MKPLTSSLPATSKVCYCMETWEKVCEGYQQGRWGEKRLLEVKCSCFTSNVHAKKPEACCNEPWREEQLLISITMSTARRRDGDKSVLSSPTCSAQLSPRLLLCSVAFCLPCNHYNTSFPLASQCLDTHGEMQPGTTRSIKGCPLQREGGGIYQSFIRQKPHTPHFQTDLEEGNDGLLQALFKSWALFTHDIKRTPLRIQKRSQPEVALKCVKISRQSVLCSSHWDILDGKNFCPF